ncbi:ATP-dependent DNA ligase [soil metagenome]
MHAFVDLYDRLDATTSRDAKLAALEEYFRVAPREDAAWALWFLVGNRLKRVVPSGELHDAAVARTGLPGWLIAQCRDAVGDGSETLALLLPEPAAPRELGVRALVEEFIQPMRRGSAPRRAQLLAAVWDALPARERFVFHKLISGSFRVGVSRGMAVRALAGVAGVEPAEMEHRVMGTWTPTPANFEQIMLGAGEKEGIDSASKPYPFYLAQQLNVDPAEVLGDARDWTAEWKWDGIRAQLIRRRNPLVPNPAGAASSAPILDPGRTALWSRGEEVISDRFPEIIHAGDDLPFGTVLDGEVLAWEDGRPLPFADLQTRIGRKEQSSRLFHDVPVVFAAYDVLEIGGVDIRPEGTRARRATLDALLAALPARARLVLKSSDLLPPGSWDDWRTARAESRARGVEGLMLKHADSPYGVGRTKDLARESAEPQRGWWKWKVDPYTIDAVLIYAQRGSGRRAGVFTDYTFGVWDGPVPGTGKLVPIAKAYSGLTDEEINAVDKFIRAHTLTGGAGAAGSVVRAVEPTLVFEIAFEGLAESNRHKSGIALRFPRMARWRTDKRADEADTLAHVQAILANTKRSE